MSSIHRELTLKQAPGYTRRRGLISTYFLQGGMLLGTREREILSKQTNAYTENTNETIENLPSLVRDLSDHLLCLYLKTTYPTLNNLLLA